MLELVRPIDSDTLERMLRYGFATAIDRIHLRPGCRPLGEGLGGRRELGFRQLSGDDTRAVAGLFLQEARVSERLRNTSLDAAREIHLFLELPEGGLAEASFCPCRGGLAATLELYPPLPPGQRTGMLEG